VGIKHRPYQERVMRGEKDSSVDGAANGQSRAARRDERQGGVKSKTISEGRTPEPAPLTEEKSEKRGYFGTGQAITLRSEDGLWIFTRGSSSQTGGGEGKIDGVRIGNPQRKPGILPTE